VLCELDAAVTACEGRDGRSEPPDERHWQMACRER
jgi:hypothetical protein